MAIAPAGLLLDRLYADNGQTLGELCANLDMSRQAVTKHLGVLEEANLVVTVWRGREKLHYLNPEPIEGIAEPMDREIRAPAGAGAPRPQASTGGPTP